MCKHVFTPLAPEVTDSSDSVDAEMFKWCIRCGTLKLGKQLFSPGPLQKKHLVSE